MPNFSPGLTRRTYFWAAFKAAAARKSGVLQYDSTDGATYQIWFYDGPEVHTCAIWLDSALVPQTYVDAGQYTPDQNDADRADFEANYLPSANATIEPRAADGRPAVRLTTANKTKNFNLKAVSFTAGDPSSLKSLRADFTAAGDVVMTCRDVNGAVTTDPTLAVRTTIDLEPPYNYEIIGGWVDLPPSLVGGTSGLWWISCVGVPDIPAPYGGSVPFVNGVNMELVYSGKVVSDGRATQFLTYDPVHHTSKVRWTMLHPPGATERFQLYVETFT